MSLRPWTMSQGETSDLDSVLTVLICNIQNIDLLRDGQLVYYSVLALLKAIPTGSVPWQLFLK